MTEKVVRNVTFTKGQLSEIVTTIGRETGELERFEIANVTDFYVYTNKEGTDCLAVRFSTENDTVH